MQITLPDGTMRTLLPDGTAITALPDGTTITTLPDGSVITVLPDGTTVKTLSDGTTVTTPPEKTASWGPRVAQVDVKTQEDPENRLTGKAMDLGSLVAGLAGWGLVSPGSRGGPSLLNREGFDKLERGRKLRRFRRWRDGAFENSGISFDSQTDHTVLSTKKPEELN
jgi:hypothetical protein